MFCAESFQGREKVDLKFFAGAVILRTSMSSSGSGGVFPYNFLKV